MNDERLDNLIDAHLNGVMADAERLELEDRLLHSAMDRARFWEMSEMHVVLHEGAQQKLAVSPPVVPIQSRMRSVSWLSWRPLTAAAAGIVFGIFCTSVVFGYVVPSLSKAMTLLQESFESGPAPLVTGVPIEPGRWSGDYTEVVGELQGVRPESGKKMLRFLRGDYEGRSIPSSHSSDVFRLVDVRPYRSEFADGGAVVQLTAVFNAVAFSEDENFSATLTLFALNASLVGNEVVKGENVLSTESLAFSRSSKVVVDRDPATWQKVSNELRLPPSTEYLMIRVGMSNDAKSPGKRRDSFAGHFADKVQLVLARRSEIPVP